MALKRVSAGRAIVLKQTIEGKPGDRGKPGINGVTTTIEKVVHVQEPSKPGLTGASPEHEVRNGEIRFKNPDGTWGKFITVQPSSSGGGGWATPDLDLALESTTDLEVPKTISSVITEI